MTPNAPLGSSRTPACFIAGLMSASFLLGCQPTSHTYRDTLADASRGQCQLGLPGDGCDLAVRIDGTAYFVDGTGIDDHGDAHAGDGLCNAVRRARVSGQVEGDRFVATRFELLPDAAD